MASVEVKTVQPSEVPTESFETIRDQMEDWFWRASKSANSVRLNDLNKIDWEMSHPQAWIKVLLGSIEHVYSAAKKAQYGIKCCLKLAEHKVEDLAEDLPKANKLRKDVLADLRKAMRACWNFYYNVQREEGVGLMYPDYLKIQPGLQKLRKVQKCLNLWEEAAPVASGDARAGAGGP